MQDWTEDETISAMRYGICEFCGGPRGVKTDRSGPTIWLLLVCLRCGRQAT